MSKWQSNTWTIEGAMRKWSERKAAVLEGDERKKWW